MNTATRWIVKGLEQWLVPLAMGIFLGAVAAAAVPCAHAADRIDMMRQGGDLGCYAARLRAAGAHFREQGVPLAEIRILGEMTDQERAFVAREIKAGYESTWDDGRPAQPHELLAGVVCGK